MKKVFISNVRIGILDNNSNFVMSAFVESVKMYFQVLQPENSEYTKRAEILGYQLSDNKDGVALEIFSSDENIYVVKTFSDEYVEYLNKLYFNLVELVKNCKIKSKSTLMGCNILGLTLMSKVSGNELLIPPISGIKIHGYGNIVGHKYLKHGYGKTSKIVDIDSINCTITSTRTIYNILSLSPEYEDYIKDMIFELETLLKQY
jgi:hypothetical protein